MDRTNFMHNAVDATRQNQKYSNMKASLLFCLSSLSIISSSPNSKLDERLDAPVMSRQQCICHHIMWH